MQPSQGTTTISMLKRTILAGEITRISRGPKTSMTTQGQTILTTSNLQIINTILLTNSIFSAKFHTLPTKVLQLKRNLTWRRLWKCKIRDNWHTTIVKPFLGY